MAHAAIDDRGKRLAIDRQSHRGPQFRIVEGRLVDIDQHSAGDIDTGHFANRLRRLLSEILQGRRGNAVGRADIEIAGEEGQIARRDLAQDRKLDAVEIGPARFPVTRVFRELDVFVRLELKEFERTGDDRRLPYPKRRHMAWVDWSPSSGDQG